MTAITVKLADKEIVLGERSTRILRFVALYSQQIEEIPVGKLILHFKGRSLVPELTRAYRPLQGEEKE